MTKFKGKHSARQYLKNKPIKWGFKWWCRADSKNGYLHQFDLYLEKTEFVEHNLGGGDGTLQAFGKHKLCDFL